MDRSLQQFAATASPGAFGEIVARYAPAVRAHAAAKLRDAHAADDVTQAVFIMLSKKAKSLPPQTVLSGWLHGATRLACLAYLRAARRRHTHEQQAASLRPELSASVPADLETREVVNEALARLSGSDRDVLLMRFQDNLSVPEVADRLGLSAEAVKKRITRASDRLRLVAERLGMASVAPGVDWAAGPLTPPPADPLLTQTVMNSVFTPSACSVGAVEIVNGAATMVRRKFLITVSLGSIAVAAVAGGAMFMFPAPADPVAPPEVRFAIAEAPARPSEPQAAQTRPAPRRFYTPADTFQRLADSIARGDEKAAIDCFIVSGDPEELAIVSLVRLSAAEARLEAAWKEKFPGTSHPSLLGNRMDQVLRPMVPLLVLSGPQMMPASGDLVELRLRDAGIPIPDNSPAQQWQDVAIRLVRGTDGQWRFDLGMMMTLVVFPSDAPPPPPAAGQKPLDLSDLAAVNKRLFGDLVSAVDAFTADVKADEFTDAGLAADDYRQRFETAMRASGIGGFNFAPSR